MDNKNKKFRKYKLDFPSDFIDCNNEYFVLKKVLQLQFIFFSSSSGLEFDAGNYQKFGLHPNINKLFYLIYPEEILIFKINNSNSDIIKITTLKDYSFQIKDASFNPYEDNILITIINLQDINIPSNINN